MEDKITTYQTKAQLKRTKQSPSRLDKRSNKEEGVGPEDKVGPENKMGPKNKVGPENKVGTKHKVGPRNKLRPPINAYCLLPIAYSLLVILILILPISDTDVADQNCILLYTCAQQGKHQRTADIVKS